jgi:hypothetical protein
MNRPRQLLPLTTAIGVLIAAVAVAVAACQVVAGIERVDKTQRTSAVDGGPVDPNRPNPNDPCKHMRPLPAPESDDDRNGELPGFYLAIRATTTSGTMGGAPIGFDLDNVCTCDKRTETFRAGASSCTPKTDDCDSDGGVDNKGANLFGLFAPSGFDFDERAVEQIEEGRRGLLLYITKYNGKPNDSEVIVGAMVTHGIRDGDGCGTRPTAKGWAPPGWCGHDRWSYSAEYVKPGSAEPVGNGNGYVTNGTLVFQSDLPLTMFFGSTTVNFGSPITAGKLEKKPDGFWKLSAVLAGRIPANELLAAVGTFNDGDDLVVCKTPVFPAIKQSLCDSADINRSNRFDFQGGTCDAVSMALSFTAEQSDVGGEFTPPIDTDGGCEENQVPPGTYVCP